MRILQLNVVILLTFVFLYRVVNRSEAEPGGEETDSLRITYQFEKPIVSQVEVFKRPFKKVVIPLTHQLDREGEPVLPIKFTAILLPYGKEAGKVTVIPGKKETLEGNFNITPGQRPIPLGQEYKAEYVPPKPDIYDSNAPFPSGRIFKSQTVVRKGYRIINGTPPDLISWLDLQNGDQNDPDAYCYGYVSLG